MILSIDNRDLQVMVSILEVLARAKKKGVDAHENEGVASRGE